MAVRVLLVCTGNTCRSSMGEALLKRMASALGDGEGLEVRSAGIAAPDGAPASENAVLAMKEMGLDLSGHRAARLTREAVEWADIILTMTASQKARVISRFDAGSKTHTILEYAGAGDSGSASGSGVAGDLGSACESGGAGEPAGDLVGAVTPGVRGEPARAHEPGDIEDPWGGPLDKYRQVARRLDAALARAVQRMIRERRPE